MGKKLNAGLLACMLIFLINCRTSGGPGVFYQIDTVSEDWIDFQVLDLNAPDTAVFASKVELRDSVGSIAMNPLSREHFAYWVGQDGAIYHSQENPTGSIQVLPVFQPDFRIDPHARHLFLDWEGRSTNDPWRQRHLLYFLDRDGRFFAINQETQMAEPWLPGVRIPIRVDSIHVYFGDPDYPVFYRDSNTRLLMRIDRRSAQANTWMDQALEGLLFMDENHTVFLINPVGLIRMDRSGQSTMVKTGFAVTNPRSGLVWQNHLYLAAMHTETRQVRGKTIW